MQLILQECMHLAFSARMQIKAHACSIHACNNACMQMGDYKSPFRCLSVAASPLLLMLLLTLLLLLLLLLASAAAGLLLLGRGVVGVIG